MEKECLHQRVDEMIVVIKELMGNDCRYQRVDRKGFIVIKELMGKDCHQQRVDGKGSIVIKELMENGVLSSKS